ncbi:MAG: SIMPL domain-containing protein [Thermodesulfobacteriota bacterium]
MSKRQVITVAMSFAFVFLFVTSSYAQESKYERPTINVVGNGEVFLSPDVANISFSVETTAKTASEAVNKNAEITNKVLEALKSKIGKDDKVSTSRYNLSAMYEYNNETKKSEFTGYRATNSVSVKTYNLDNIGSLIDSATQAGANRIEGLSFDTTKRNEITREALAKAVKDARATAQTVAGAAGVKITSIYQISPSYSYPAPVYKDYAVRMEAASPAPPPPTTIEAGEISIKASVNMVFGIE